MICRYFVYIMSNASGWPYGMFYLDSKLSNKYVLFFFKTLKQTVKKRIHTFNFKTQKNQVFKYKCFMNIFYKDQWSDPVPDPSNWENNSDQDPHLS